MKSTVLYFIREKFHREVWIDPEDDTYRIIGMSNTFGKNHTNPNEYIKKMLRSGWKKCDRDEYFAIAHNWRPIISHG